MPKFRLLRRALGWGAAFFAVTALVASFARTPHHALHFDLPAPRTLAHPLTLWATWYWTPSYISTHSPHDIPLKDEHEHFLGLRLPAEQFCHAAVQGSVRIDGKIYTFGGIGKQKMAPCEQWRPDMPQAPYVLFSPSDSLYGEGDGPYSLVPYRSVAVDEKVIPLGTVLYIPRARGCWVTLPDGTCARHDGYFFAADNGYGVDRNHIDVFNGLSDQNPFPWVQSLRTATFAAYVVTDPAIRRRLMRLHLAGMAP